MADEVRETLLAAARTCLLRSGFATLSTRAITEEAGVGLGHIHYHFGSKRNLVLALLDQENARLLARQAQLYEADLPLWKQWEQACDYLEDDLASGYVRVLHEMIAAGWSEPTIAERVVSMMHGWYDLLTTLAERVEPSIGGLGPFTAREIAVLAGDAFLGAEALLLLDDQDDRLPHRSALRRVGELLRVAEET